MALKNRIDVWSNRQMEKPVEGWIIIGLAVALLIYCAVETFSENRLMAWLLVVGTVLEIDIGIVQIHIRE